LTLTDIHKTTDICLSIINYFILQVFIILIV